MAEIQKLLDKMNQNTNNLEKELERTLELFKQLQYDFKLDQTIQDLKRQIEEQKKLLDKTEALEKDLKDSEKSDRKDGKDSDQKNKDEKGKDQQGKDQHGKDE